MSDKLLIGKDGLRDALGLKGIFGKLVAGALYRILGIDPLNRIYPDVANLEGPEFSEEVLRRLGISYEVPEDQLANIPSEGGFITVSNHHFGGADGLILNAIVGSQREDFRILTTFLLAKVSNLESWFIPVDNFSSGGAKSIKGIRAALGHIAAGGALGLFPAGEVATWQKKGLRTALRQAQGPEKRIVEDKPWADNIIKMIKNAGLPVVPIYFNGENSKLFHRLGRIHPFLRTLRLVREFTGQKGARIQVRIGKAVPSAEISGMDIPTLREYLRNRCYALEAQCVRKDKAADEADIAPLAEPVAPDLVRAQMARLEDKVVFSSGDYKGYLIDASDAPDATRELYRLREETFRAIGEGTGKPLDTDPYDEYYKHLILWNIPNGEIVGSYRVGYGSQIIPRFGREGLYTASLLRFGPDADTILPHGMELGRSFVTLKYQREVLPLKLMLSGLAVAMAQDPEASYCVGTVTISDAIPDLYKSLAMYFIERDFRMPDAERFATPPNPFKPDFLRVNPEGLLARIPKGDIDAFDRLLGAISNGKYRLPVLFRKYFSCGAKVACFNVDPLFSDCLDGMIVLKKSDFPEAIMRSLIRPFPKETGEAVLRHFYGTQNPE